MGQTNHAQGHEAETRAASYLQSFGFEIIQLNWRTRLCEIDIVARKRRTIYFVEVKYRSHQRQGSGLDYITSRKLEQMEFAATCWIQENKWTGGYELSAIELSGPDFVVTAFLPHVV